MVIVVIIGGYSIYKAFTGIKNMRVFGRYLMPRRVKAVKKMMKQGKDWEEIEQYIKRYYPSNLHAVVGRDQQIEKIKMFYEREFKNA